MKSANNILKVEGLLVYYIGLYFDNEHNKNKLMCTKDLVELVGKNYDYVTRIFMQLKKDGIVELVEIKNNNKYYKLTKKGKNIYKGIINLINSYNYNLYSKNANTHKVASDQMIKKK